MRKLHPLTAVRDGLAYAVQVGSFGFFAGAMSSGIDLVPIGTVFVLAPLGALLGAGYGVARYLAFEYELDESTLNITSGVLLRQNREIPLGRVQNVDVHQSFLQRLFGLAVVRFETAGGGETEAVLRLVEKDEADRLRRDLRRRKRDAGAGGDSESVERESAAGVESESAAGVESESAAGVESESAAGVESESAADVDREPRAGTDQESTGAAERRDSTGAERPRRAADERAEPWVDDLDDEETVLFELSTRDLLVLSGLTFRWGVVPLLLFALPLGGDLLWRNVRSVLRDGAGGTAGPVFLGLAAGGLVALVLVSWLISAAITFVSYYGFRLARVGDELHYERGLLQRYSGSIPLEKVQSLAVTENVLMRRFGYAALTVETAGYSPGGDGSGGGNRVPSAVPLAERADVVAFVEDFEGVDDLSVERPPSRARRRYAGRYALVALGVTGLLAAVDRFAISLDWYWALPLAGLVVAPVAAHLKWRHLGHRTDDRHFLAREGFWRRTTRVVPYYRVQTVVAERTVFQRRWNLASVVADTAASGSLLGRDATAHDVDDGEARALHEHLRERLRDELVRRRG